MSAYNTHTTSSSSLILARFYQDIKNGAVISPETTKLLGQVGNTLYSIPSGSGAWTSIGTINSGGVAAQPMSWARIQNPNDPNFVSGLTDCIVICTGSGGPYVYDGANLYTPAAWSSAASALWCAVINGILWFGGIPTAPNQIFGTGDGVITSMETLPGFRNFVLSSPVTGLCAAGSGPNGALVVGCNGGISVIYGTGPSTFYKQDLPLGDGVTAGRTLVSVDGTVFFLAHNAIYQFDLVSVPRIISKKITPWVQNSQFVGGYPMTQNRGLSWACVYNNRYYLGYCSVTATPDTILVYDLIVGGWTVLRPNNGAASMIILDAPSDPDPYEALIGTATTAQAMIWDYVSTNPQSAAYDDGPTNTVPVLAACATKNFRLGVPGTNKFLARYYPELFLAGSPWTGYLTVNVDGGSSAVQSVVTTGSMALGFLWDTGKWDVSTWGGTTTLVRFGPPLTRCDFSIQGSEFSFGMQNQTAQPPWMFVGGTGVYNQYGRT
jgi:hypothetical protein